VAGVPAGNGFTVQGTGDLGRPLYQALYIAVEQSQPLTINNDAPNLSAGFAGQAYTAYFFVIGGAAPYTWSLASGQLPPGLHLQTFTDPRDANDELVGTSTTTGTYNFTMRVTDYNGDQATQQFTVTVHPSLQFTATTLPTGTVCAPYSSQFTAQGGLPPYYFYIFANDPLPPGPSFGSVAPDHHHQSINSNDVRLPVCRNCLIRAHLLASEIYRHQDTFLIRKGRSASPR
jgi:hypothetical protein